MPRFRSPNGMRQQPIPKECIGSLNNVRKSKKKLNTSTNHNCRIKTRSHIYTQATFVNKTKRKRKRKRCPKGMRQHPYTKECVPKTKIIPIKI